MMDDAQVFERFVALAKRELHADDVRLLALGEAAPDADNVLVTRLDDGRHVIASFAGTPKDREALTRRLAMLVSTFSDALARPSERLRARQPIAVTLHEELKALATRARAADVFIIDIDSPVVWGRAAVMAQPRARQKFSLRDVSDGESSARFADDESGPLRGSFGSGGPRLVEAPRSNAPPPLESARVVSEVVESDDDADRTHQAIDAVRRLPSLDALHKGRHLRHVERGEHPLLAVSFSGIYIMCLVFDGDFDELRAERAATDALPRVERLVLALPPVDPDPPQPMGGVVAMRARRRS